MAKCGPKLKVIDWEQFDKLCAFQCTLEEIASWFNCSPDTIENRCKQVHKMRFSELHKMKSAKGKMSLRRRLFELAHSDKHSKSAAAVAIFLSKQHLGYRDRIEDDRFRDLKPLVIETSNGTKTLSLAKDEKKVK